MQRFVGFFGRLFFSIIFIASGIGKIMKWDATEQYLTNQMLDVLSKSYKYEWAQTLFDRILPLAPMLLVAATVIELAGGLLILLGIQVRLGAALICLFLIPTTFLFHNFWALEGSAQQLQMIMFMKNLSIFGGALILLAFGNGPSSLKAKKVGK